MLRHTQENRTGHRWPRFLLYDEIMDAEYDVRQQFQQEGGVFSGYMPSTDGKKYEPVHDISYIRENRQTKVDMRREKREKGEFISWNDLPPNEPVEITPEFSAAQIAEGQKGLELLREAEKILAEDGDDIDTAPWNR